MTTDDGFSHKPASPWVTDQGTLLCLTQPTEANIDSHALLLFPHWVSCHYSKNKTQQKKPSQKTQLMTRQENGTSSPTITSPLKPTWALQGFPGPGTGATDGGQEPLLRGRGCVCPQKSTGSPALCQRPSSVAALPRGVGHVASGGRRDMVTPGHHGLAVLLQPSAQPPPGPAGVTTLPPGHRSGRRSSAALPGTPDSLCKRLLKTAPWWLPHPTPPLPSPSSGLCSTPLPRLP